MLNLSTQRTTPSQDMALCLEESDRLLLDGKSEWAGYRFIASQLCENGSGPLKWFFFYQMTLKLCQ